jgi:hypothetical protein
MGIILVTCVMWGRAAEADPIRLYFHEGFAGDGGVGSIGLEGLLDLNYSARGGSLEWIGGSLGNTSSDVSYPWPPPTYPIDGFFSVIVGLAAPGTTDQFAGPALDVMAPVTGTIIGPRGLPGRWSGGYSGTATSVSPGFSATPQDLSQLPAPLRDILNHPDHLHINVVVDGGNRISSTRP